MLLAKLREKQRAIQTEKLLKEFFSIALFSTAIRADITTGFVR